MRPNLTRAAAALVAAIAWTALGLQLAILISDYGARGEGAFAALWRFFAFFTVLTNGLVAVVMSGKAIGGRAAPSHALVTGTAMNIVMVGLLYHFLLAQTWNPQGWRFVADALLHYAVPSATLLFWLTLERKSALTARHALIWLAYPLAYLIYSFVRGAAEGYFPYPFLDPPRLGPTQTALNAVALMIAFAAMSALFVFANNALANKQRGA